MTLPPHIKVVFFFALLISLSHNNGVKAQSLGRDTITKTAGDTLQAKDNSESLEEPISYYGQDSVVSYPKEGRAILYGKAKVDFGGKIIEAEFIEIDYNKNVITAFGKKDSLGNNIGTPVFKDGSQTMEAEKIMYNTKTKKGKIINAWTKQGELKVFGNAIKKDSNNVTFFKNMKCALCSEDDGRTLFKASKAKVIPNDKIVTGPMYLEIGGVPTPLGLPFGFFPNTQKQHNGILIPTFGNSPERGFNLRQGGYYWGINDKTDMIIRGDIYANGSWALSSTNNYNLLYQASGFTYLSYSQFNIGDPDIPISYSKQSSYEVRWTHNQDNKNNPNVRFGANVNYVKNQSFNRFNNINSGTFLQNSFQSNIAYTKTFKLSSLSINASHNQSTIGKSPVDITFPALTFNVNRFFPFKREAAVKQNVLDKIGISYVLTAQNTISGYDSSIFSGNFLEKMKNGIKQSIPISTNFNVLKYITVSPQINLSSVTFLNSTSKEFVTSYNNRAVDTIISKRNKGLVSGYDANFSTSINTKLYFDFLFKNGPLKQIRYLLIPTLNYNYRPDFGEEQYGFWKKVQSDTLGNYKSYTVFEDNIYAGPSKGKQNALGINLNNTIDAKIKQKTDTGIVYKKVAIIQNLGISTNYNFAAQEFKLSNINLTARTVLYKNININASSSFDPYAIDEASNNRINKLLYDQNKKLARLVNANLAIGTSINSSMFVLSPESEETKKAKPSKLIIEKTTWNLSASYLVSVSNPTNKKLETAQTLNFGGDFMPTKFWKITISSGYDFINKKISYTTFDVYRDLKCWEARIRWVPFGINKSYNLSINLKMSMLSQIKIPKNRQTLDNPQLINLLNN